MDDDSGLKGGDHPEDLKRDDFGKAWREEYETQEEPGEIFNK